eukprot:gene6995-12622_t
MRKVFDAIDVDMNGKITKDELKQLLERLNTDATKDSLDAMFKAADKDGSGAIEFDEFLESLQTVMSPPSSEDLSQAFAMMDENGDGFLTKDEIKAGLIKAGEPLSDATIEEMVKAADQNNDGKVSYKAYVQSFLSCHMTFGGTSTGYDLIEKDNPVIVMANTKNVIQDAQLP